MCGWRSGGCKQRMLERRVPPWGEDKFVEWNRVTQSASRGALFSVVARRGYVGSRLRGCDDKARAWSVRR